MSGAIDVWCNLFTDEGIKKVFTENPEVAYSMGESWGRDHLMVPFEPDEFIDRMDAQGVERVIIPSIKMMLYRDRELISIDWQTIAALIEKYPDRISGSFGIDPVGRAQGRQGTRERRHQLRLRRRPRAPVRVQHTDERLPVLPGVHQVRRAGRPRAVPGRPLGRVHAVGERPADPARRHRDLLPRDQAGRLPHRLAVDRGAHRDGVEAPQRLHRGQRSRPEVLGPEAGASSSTPAGAASARSCGAPTTR